MTWNRSHFVRKIARSLERDRDLPIAVKVHKAIRYLRATGLAPLHLRKCDQVGARARALGQPMIENLGQIVIGTDFNVNSSMAPVQFRTGPNGSVHIGDGVSINFGCVVSADCSVTIGDRVSIGPYSIVSDSETPGLPVARGESEGEPVLIGNSAWLAGRVTVLPGSNIGEGAVITAGSVVSGVIPPHVVAGGVPARVLRRVHPNPVPAHASVETVERYAAEPDPAGTPVPQSSGSTLDGILVADFTADELAQRLTSDPNSPRLRCDVAPFGQVTPTLLRAAQAEAPSRDYAVIWTRPDAVSPSFAKLTRFESVDMEDVTREVEAFCSLLIEASRAFRFVFVPNWVVPTYQRGLGLLDLKCQTGVANALMRMNLHLSEALAKVPNAYVLNSHKWVESAGRTAFTPRLWHMGKIPFHSDVFAAAALDIKSAVSSLVGGARKIVILDLDDTLWGGVVGDVGWQNLRLGGHDSVGEAFVAFQRQLQALSRRGIVLAIASKNDESVAIDAIRSHPEMVLKLDDFVGWKITWNDKAQNIVDLLNELNLGPQSAVFIDDNPLERARVREALPEVLVPQWPDDKLLYASALSNLKCFDGPTLTYEDAERTKLYALERQRAELKDQVGSLDEWLTSLGTRLQVERLNSSNLQRATQLLNKTNQMNLSTRRLSEENLRAWAASPNRIVWTFKLTDRFGDSGLIGLLSLDVREQQARIVDFVLSCRVMGRKVEESMLHVAIEHARALGVEMVTACFVRTSKNKPCLEFWQSCGFGHDEGGLVFWWPAAQSYGLPGSVRLARAEDLPLVLR